MIFRQYIGDKKFYRSVLAVAVPIMIQSGITNFVSLLDNIMVGSLGTESMSGVSIVNQFIFVFNLLIFGAISAAGIFTAQYHGLGDPKGVRNTFRLKFLINLTAGILGVLTFVFFGSELISLFLHDSNADGDIALTLSEGERYLRASLFGLLPYVISQVYASTMRETGETVMPMVASIVAVGTNFVLNAVLIYGLFGAPPLGVVGAAIATTVSRYVELAFLIIVGHTRKQKYPFLTDAYRSFRVPRALCAQVAVKGLPLMVNELLWALAITLRNQCYSTRGLEVVAAQNINSTIENVFSVVYLSLGSSIAIVIGNLLGAGKIEEAKDKNRKLVAFSIFCASCIGVLLAIVSPYFPLLYNTSDSVRNLATLLILFSALFMPFRAYAHAAYFTLRSGGKVFVTFLFDCVYMWSIVMPIAFLLAHLTSLPILPLFLLTQGAEVAKCIFGMILLRRTNWAKRLVSNESSR